ncbi:MAG: thermonuclease family protein [Sphingomonas sp.]|nr:thermonuclease family protein [Sphingomonas sp.]
MKPWYPDKRVSARYRRRPAWYNKARKRRNPLSRLHVSGSAITLLVASAAFGFAGGAFSTRSISVSEPGYGETISGCSVTDGDTVRCGNERIRLVGIDSPELPGHCRKGRICVSGDPYAATSSLKSALSFSMSIERLGKDHYGRTIAAMVGEKGDLSCHQLQTGHAIYKPAWDNGKRIARTCPQAIFR